MAVVGGSNEKSISLRSLLVFLYCGGTVPKAYTVRKPDDFLYPRFLLAESDSQKAQLARAKPQQGSVFSLASGRQLDTWKHVDTMLTVTDQTIRTFNLFPLTNLKMRVSRINNVPFKAWCLFAPVFLVCGWLEFCFAVFLASSLLKKGFSSQ